MCVTGLDPLAGPGETGQKQGPSAFMMTSCWGGKADSGGCGHNLAGKDGGVASHDEPKQRIDQRAGSASFCILKEFVDVLRPGLTWMGLPKREEAVGSWCLQSPEALDTLDHPHSSTFRD